MDLSAPTPAKLTGSQTSASLPSAFSWAVAWTKARAEKALAEYFASRQVSYFLPLVQVRRAYGKRIRHSSLPLFPGYVFFDHQAIKGPDVYESRKVAQILVPQDEGSLRSELANLSRALNADGALREARFGVPGRPVYVARGPLKGLYGEFVRFGAQCRLIIRVGFIGKAAELAIDEAFIEPVR